MTNPVDALAPSATEQLKAASRALRGTIADALQDGAPSFADDNTGLLKFHGIYQQDDRDRRVKRGAPVEKAWSMMVRLAIPGGVLTAAQYLALDALADSVANGTLRLTTRQSVQFHGVLKGDLRPLIVEVNRVLLSTLAACGDVSRNVMASPLPLATPAHRAAQQLARDIAVALRPATGAYAEIWLDGERVHDSRDEEPLYGTTYLPRKFKVGVELDTDNAIEVFSYDCGLVGITEGGVVIGYNLVAGGGLGLTHNKAATFARLASSIAFVAPEHAVAAVRAVCEVYRDEGNRSNRKQARLKYLVERLGVAAFTEAVQARVPFPLHPPRPQQVRAAALSAGPHPQGDGRWFWRVPVLSGRIADTTDAQLRTAIREAVARTGAGVRLTPSQDLILSDLTATGVETVRAVFASHGLRRPGLATLVEEHAMACPALPTCGLALAESERMLPGLITELEAEVARLGVAHVPLTLRSTGCPNGCARPYTADVGIVGRRLGVYHVYVGGSRRGDRLADLFAADVPREQIVPTLRPLLERFAAERHPDEELGDFYQRLCGPRPARHLLTGHEQPSAPAVAALESPPVSVVAKPVTPSGPAVPTVVSSS